MKNIGIFHYQLGRTDGVSLEIEKWKQVLEEMGHQVHRCAGDLGTVDGTLIEELYHHRPDARRINYNTFTALRDYDETGYRKEVEDLTNSIVNKLRAFIEEKKIDMLIPHNIWSVAASPPVAIAMAQVMREYQLPTIAHNHDFYWERVDGVALTCATAIEIADKYLPPRDELIQHGVINSLGRRELLARKGIEATIIPNVFDFKGSHWQADQYNANLRQRIGLNENDIFILQATRIVPRKGIELAVDFVKALNTSQRRSHLIKRGLYDGRPFTSDNRIVFVLAGYAQDDLTGLYLNRLKNKIAQAGIDAIFIDEMIDGDRQVRNGEKIYSLWDTYVFADFVTYPSLWEGWGNQLLEAMVAKLPILLYEYPVFEADLKTSGIDAVSLGSQLSGYDQNGLAQVSQDVIESAADQAIELLTDTNARQRMVEHNFSVGQRYYSLEALKEYLEKFMMNVA